MTNYQNMSVEEIFHDYAKVRGDIGEEYAQDQLVRIFTERENRLREKDRQQTSDVEKKDVLERFYDAVADDVGIPVRLYPAVDANPPELYVEIDGNCWQVSLTRHLHVDEVEVEADRLQSLGPDEFPREYYVWLARKTLLLLGED